MWGLVFLTLGLFFLLFYSWKFQLEIALSSLVTNWLQASVQINFFGWRTLKRVDLNHLEPMLLEPVKKLTFDENFGSLIYQEISSDFITPLLKYLKKIKIAYRWHTVIGLEEPGLSGILSGILWTIKGFSPAMVSRFMSLKQVEIKVSPVMNELVLQSKLNCIIELRLVQIIPIAGILIMQRIRRR